MYTYRVSDYRTENLTTDEVIRKCMDDAKSSTQRTIVFDEKEYVISQAILLPPDTTVILDGCHIMQADYTVDNVFRGTNVIVDPNQPLGMPLACEKTKNIRIIGKNGAHISGPQKNARAYHTTLHEEQDMVGDFWGWRTITVCLSNCDVFELSGVFFDKSRCWTASFDRCTNGLIQNIRFRTDCKNGDGIDIRSGCHHIVIRNISGTTSDDTVACTAIGTSTVPHYPMGNYLYPLEPCTCLTEKTQMDMDISDISIENVRSNGNHHAVICLAADGHKIYDIRLNRIVEANAEGKMWREAVVKVYTGYGKSCSTDDIYNIHAENVLATYADYAFYCNTELKNCYLKNIHHRDQKASPEIKLDYTENVRIIDGIRRDDIRDMYTSLGIKPTDCVVMHVSLKSIGKIDGGAEQLLAASTDYLKNGLFIVPTHTWANVNRDTPLYNVLETVPCVGAFAITCARVANESPNAIRSLHPTHSAAVFGQDCKRFAEGEEKLHSRTPRNGLWGRLYDENAKVLLVGVGLDKNTYIHAIDEEINGLPADENAYFDAQVIDYNGKRIDVPRMNIYTYWPSSTFGLFETILFDAGALTYSDLGGAQVICFNVKKAHDVIIERVNSAKNTKMISELL